MIQYPSLSAAPGGWLVGRRRIPLSPRPGLEHPWAEAPSPIPSPVRAAETAAAAAAENAGFLPDFDFLIKEPDGGGLWRLYKDRRLIYDGTEIAVRARLDYWRDAFLRARMDAADAIIALYDAAAAKAAAEPDRYEAEGGDRSAVDAIPEQAAANIMRRAVDTETLHLIAMRYEVLAAEFDAREKAFEDERAVRRRSLPLYQTACAADIAPAAKTAEFGGET